MYGLAGAVNYACQLYYVKCCQLSSPKIAVNYQKQPVNRCQGQPCTAMGPLPPVCGTLQPPAVRSATLVRILTPA